MSNRLADRMRKLRVERDLTAREVAQSVNVPESTYRAWEAGRAVRGEPYVALSKVFGISVHELLSGVKPRSQEAHSLVLLIERDIAKLKIVLNRLY